MRVVDSLSVTMGEGLVVLEAAQPGPGGAAPSTRWRRRLNAVVEQVNVYGAVDTLEYLKRGGRIGGARALLGSVLSIKPVIRVADGVVEKESSQRTRGRSLRYLADKLSAAGPIARLAVFGADAPDMDQFLTLLDDLHPTEKVLLGEVGPVIGTSHRPRGHRCGLDPRQLTRYSRGLVAGSPASAPVLTGCRQVPSGSVRGRGVSPTSRPPLRPAACWAGATGWWCRSPAVGWPTSGRATMRS